jgi:hypothetical protein
MSEKLDGVGRAQIFAKQANPNTYVLMRIKARDKYKYGFRTWYSQFEYQVMPLGLTNSPAKIQPYIDHCLWPIIDDLAGCYLEDILTYSTNDAEHQEQV